MSRFGRSLRVSLGCLSGLTIWFLHGVRREDGALALRIRDDSTDGCRSDTSAEQRPCGLTIHDALSADDGLVHNLGGPYQAGAVV